MIKLNALNKFFNKGKQNEIHVINDVTIELPEKGMVAAFGRSGCGKTTLLNVIGGLDKYDSGSLTIDGKNISKNTDVIRNRYIGYIFQNYNLNKSESCFDNVADALRLCGMSDEDEIEKRVMAALSNVGMDKYAKRTPDTLSGGQQQRIAIARAIVKNPRIILADEPTGNLDEANTVMIMDLLKAISKDHLVVLVTHEANLVDYYCDTVIELSDGKVVGTRTNSSAGGLSVRDKNDIYLGEFEKSELSDEKADIEYYGDKCKEPVKLRIINNSGKIYIQVETPNVKVIDASSEIKIKEGVFEQKDLGHNLSEKIDMTDLPPVNGERFGRLFTLKSSIKSGYTSNFKISKKGNKLLRGCMCLFAAVIVFMGAMFGTSFGDIINAKNSYNHNVFYVNTPNGEISAKLNAAEGADGTGIDYVRMYYQYTCSDQFPSFAPTSFETFSTSSYSEGFSANAVFMDNTLAKNLTLIAGKKEGLSDLDILITTNVADKLIKNSPLGYVKEYADLVGLACNTFTYNGKKTHIAGVVQSDEPAVYLTPFAMADYEKRNTGTMYYLATDYGMSTTEGEAIYFLYDSSIDEINVPVVGETVKIHGKEMKIGRVIRYYGDYSSWLSANHPENSVSSDDYFRKYVNENNPSLEESTTEFWDAVGDAKDKFFFDYLDYYYSYFDDFIKEYNIHSSDLYVSLYLIEGIKEVKYALTRDNSELYYAASLYKEENGTYPTLTQANEILSTQKYSFNQLLSDIYNKYSQKQYNVNHLYECAYLVSREDYIDFSKQIGKTDASAFRGYYRNSIEKGTEYEINEVEGYYAPAYTLIHSYNPTETAEWLSKEFPEYSFGKEIYTPDNIFSELISDKTEEIIISIIVMSVMLFIMSICMYFIMRSSLMNRIKEVGIYRAIGVSKKNLVFRFLVEATVLTTLTVLIGYLFSSVFLTLCMGMSTLMKTVFFYPFWFALVILAILYVMCLFFGIVPIISLLRRTPSEILSKYDI